MKRTLALAATVIAAALSVAGCTTGDSKPGTASAKDHATPRTATKLDAATALNDIAAMVTTAKQNGTVTAANDPNHLLGRPSQYTSKVTFADSRVPASDRSGHKAGDIELGGAIEVFANAADASTRAKYIQAVTKGMPALGEYDYVHGAVVIRVSRHLTPQQARQYKEAADKLP
ncbi:hypothetical protein EST92_11755 [Streptomyces sp. TM32]|uniref:hypothetical protein n=1 Tax=Streptomyces sp. TM32 TaxID=1652669 RepID=UPI00101079A8|nr:hypothetical protein [Streptomyces sp. TM32]RXS84226.1 hypothetical protein EST92_11755 [Streptomyces sp. TM32]